MTLSMTRVQAEKLLSIQNYGLQHSLETDLEDAFRRVTTFLQDQCQAQEQFTLTLVAEESLFTRFNQAKVRQTGLVQDATLRLTWMRDQRSSYQEFPLTGDWNFDRDLLQKALEALRWELPQLPENPYLVFPQGQGSSREVHQGKLLAPSRVAAHLLPVVSELDFVGIYAAGLAVRAYADSQGQFHWFATETYSLDYSLFTPEGAAVKGTLAGSHWDQASYIAKVQESRNQLKRLAQPAKRIERGQYRTYLAPTAIAEMLYMLSWGGVSEADLQQGNSCLAMLRQGDKHLSPKFNLRENFQHGLVPRFNEFGEMAPLLLPIIQSGELVNSLISSKTAKEYGLVANGAEAGENLRSPDIAPGNLSHHAILQTLDRGLYLSNLHYLNWSDRPKGRMTGMTRYACFWVEDGEIVAPIENLRFDDSFYRFWGDQLIGLTDKQEWVPEVGTYGNRSLGGFWTPGMLVEDFTYTL
ncbi:MAG: metallopeptidase TldD-related protein [Synechococcales bacterium]|nr:metallopeptidase TldD-related protein [Synechococcales bacterium]